MSEWGRTTYGDPCRECGYDWSITQDEAVALVGAAPLRFRELVNGRDVSAQHPDLTWSVKQYVCHVADNLRIHAERLAGAAVSGGFTVGPYDENLLAKARGYDLVPIEGALWSLGRAARDWRDAVELASEKGVVLVHPVRGELSLLDICRTNAHDVDHHRWDIERSLG